MLEIRSLTCGYRRGAPVLQDLTLTAASGEITAVLGRNGCGKSTFLHTVMGEIPFEGEILIHDRPLRTLTPRERTKAISLLPQRLPTPALSVRETVTLGLCPHFSRPDAADRQRVEETIALVGLDALADRLVNTLSGGERQRAFLALLLAQNANVLLLDEPTAYTDAPFSALLYRILRDERERGKTVLIVMHDVGTALQFADRIIVLENGTLAFDGTPTEALEREIPEKHFGLTRYTAQRGEKTAVFFKAEE